MIEEKELPIINKIIPSTNANHYKLPQTLNHLAIHHEWSDIVNELQQIQKSTPKNLLNKNIQTNQDFILQSEEISLDYSLQPISYFAIQKLCDLADKIKIQQHIENLYTGELVNFTENKPALHTALRATAHNSINVDKKDIIPTIHNTLKSMKIIADKIRNNSWFPRSNIKVTDVVNIGMGGSDHGPKMAVNSLKKYHSTNINYHFLSDNDPINTDNLLSKLNPDSSIFIVASKSFTTKETIDNLSKVFEFLGNNPINEHIIAITSNINNAQQYNITHILPIWDWVGGRFSFCSAINLILMIMIGPDLFQQVLSGAQAMDSHFRETPIIRNMPIILALLEIWNINFFRAQNHLFLTYSQLLSGFIPFVQQLEMESNGKSTNKSQAIINYSTSPIVWGGIASQAEHTYYQLLHQGTHYIPIDYFFVNTPEYESINNLANKKILNLAYGIGRPNPNIFQVGINKITIKELTPTALGSLVALFEHKTYCQSVFWQINAFDQPGVEAAKKFV